ncbi:hypothetical protein JAAARDRAFT_51898, partial [Jaapia argillacea MUCL 33604]
MPIDASNVSIEKKRKRAKRAKGTVVPSNPDFDPATFYTHLGSADKPSQQRFLGPLLTIALVKRGDSAVLHEQVKGRLNSEYGSRGVLEQLCTLSITLENDSMVGKLNVGKAISFLGAFPDAQIAIFVDSRSVVTTGHVVYDGTMTEPRATSVSNILKGFLGNEFFEDLATSAGLKGLFLLTCGPTICKESSREELLQMVERECFDHILGFTKDPLVPLVVFPALLETFVRMATLNCSAVEAIEYGFGGDRDALRHSPVVLITKDDQDVTSCNAFLRSEKDKIPFGIPVPACTRCDQSQHVRCRIKQQIFIKFMCWHKLGGCGSSTETINITGRAYSPKNPELKNTRVCLCIKWHEEGEGNVIPLAPLDSVMDRRPMETSIPSHTLFRRWTLVDFVVANGERFTPGGTVRIAHENTSRLKTYADGKVDAEDFWYAQIDELRAGDFRGHESVWAKVRWFWTKKQVADTMTKGQALREQKRLAAMGRNELFLGDQFQIVGVQTFEDAFSVMHFDEMSETQVPIDIDDYYWRWEAFIGARNGKFRFGSIQAGRRHCACRALYDVHTAMRYCGPCGKWFHNACLLENRKGVQRRNDLFNEWAAAGIEEELLTLALSPILRGEGHGRAKFDAEESPEDLQQWEEEVNELLARVQSQCLEIAEATSFSLTFPIDWFHPNCNEAKGIYKYKCALACLPVDANLAGMEDSRVFSLTEAFFKSLTVDDSLPGRPQSPSSSEDSAYCGASRVKALTRNLLGSVEHSDSDSEEGGLLTDPTNSSPSHDGDSGSDSSSIFHDIPDEDRSSPEPVEQDDQAIAEVTELVAARNICFGDPAIWTYAFEELITLKPQAWIGATVLDLYLFQVYTQTRDPRATYVRMHEAAGDDGYLGQPNLRDVEQFRARLDDVDLKLPMVFAVHKHGHYWTCVFDYKSRAAYIMGRQLSKFSGRDHWASWGGPQFWSRIRILLRAQEVVTPRIFRVDWEQNGYDCGPYAAYLIQDIIKSGIQVARDGTPIIPSFPCSHTMRTNMLTHTANACVVAWKHWREDKAQHHHREMFVSQDCINKVEEFDTLGTSDKLHEVFGNLLDDAARCQDCEPQSQVQDGHPEDGGASESLLSALQDQPGMRDSTITSRIQSHGSKDLQRNAAPDKVRPQGVANMEDGSNGAGEPGHPHRLGEPGHPSTSRNMLAIARQGRPKNPPTLPKNRDCAQDLPFDEAFDSYDTGGTKEGLRALPERLDPFPYYADFTPKSVDRGFIFWYRDYGYWLLPSFHQMFYMGDPFKVVEHILPVGIDNPKSSRQLPLAVTGAYDLQRPQRFESFASASATSKPRSSSSSGSSQSSVAGDCPIPSSHSPPLTGVGVKVDDCRIVGAEEMLGLAGGEHEEERGRDVFVRGRVPGTEEYICLDLERDAIDPGKVDYTPSADIDSIIWVTKKLRFRAAIKVHVRPYVGGKPPIWKHNHTYVQILLPQSDYDREKGGLRQDWDTQPFPLCSIPQTHFGQVGDASGAFNITVLFPRMIHRHDKTGKRVTMLPTELQNRWFTKVIAPAIRRVGDPAISAYMDFTAQEHTFKSRTASKRRGDASKRKMFLFGVAALKKIQMEMKDIVE